MQTPVQLKITDTLGIQRTVLVSKPVFTIGRTPECDLRMMSRTVSRVHAQIVYEEGQYCLVDLESKTGTFINGRQISRSALKHEDCIRIGLHEDCQIQFVEIEPAGRSVAAAAVSPARTQGDEDPQQFASGDFAGASAREELKKVARFVEVNQAFRLSLSPDEVLSMVVDAAIEITTAERGFLMLKDETGQLEFKVARDRARRSLPGSELLMSRSVVDRVFSQNRSVVINDRKPTGGESSVLELRTIACIPLRRFQMKQSVGSTSILRPEVVGILYVDSRAVTGALSKTSISLLESLAFEASKCLENVRLMREERAKQQLERELATAREVQAALSPTTFREFERFGVAAESIPCRYVGGDFYDVITRSDGSSALMIGDVSGKGIAAALLASMAQGAIQAQFDAGLSLADAMTGLNRLVVQKTDSNRFITMFCGVLDPDGSFRFVNAGHNPPVLVRADGRVELLRTGSMVLGAFETARYDASETSLEDGDVIVAFTDGVTEAVNDKKEMFGDERLERLARAKAKLSAAAIKDWVLDEVQSFTRGLPQSDDITILVLKSKVPGPKFKVPSPPSGP